MKLHENQKQFQEAIRATNQATGIREVFIEKDYWVCFILKNLSTSPYAKEVVFKGGTSLSKAHKAISRFSEDVDLAILENSLPENQMKKRIKAIEAAITPSPLKSIEKTGITSKGSRIRKTIWQYQSVSEGDYGDASPDLLLEINSFAPPSPHNLTSIQTYIGEFLREENDIKTISELGLEDFKINVLDMKRTFAEKVSAVAKASFESNKNHDQLKNKIRHLYDLTLLGRIKEIQTFIDDGSFLKTIEQVKKDDLRAPGSRAEKDFREAPVFKNPKEVIEQMRATYEGQFTTLLYKAEDRPELEEIIATIQKIESALYNRL